MKFILLLICLSAQAQDMNVKVKHLYIDAQKHYLTNRSYFLNENERLRYSITLGLKMDLSKNVYLNQFIPTKVGTSQFRFIGYISELGYRSKWGIDLYAKHFSGHALDSKFKRDFPEENSVGVRFNLIKSP